MDITPALDILPVIGGQSIRHLAHFCRSQAERFYSEHRKSRLDKAPNARAFIEKGSGNRRMMRLAQEVWPKAKQFFLIRDLRDMFASMLAYNRKIDRQQFGSKNSESDAHHASNLRVAIEAYVLEWQAKADRCHVVRYEDFVLRPQETLAHLLQALELPADRPTVLGMLERARDQRATSQSHHQTTASPDASIGRYKTDLSDDLLSACEDSFGDLNRALGYQ
jgi:hypothetical protein